MYAWEALEVSKLEDDARLKEVFALIKQAASERRRDVAIPSSLFFEGLETCLINHGYKVTHGDQREPGFLFRGQKPQSLSFKNR